MRIAQISGDGRVMHEVNVKCNIAIANVSDVWGVKSTTISPISSSEWFGPPAGGRLEISSDALEVTKPLKQLVDEAVKYMFTDPRNAELIRRLNDGQ